MAQVSDPPSGGGPDVVSGALASPAPAATSAPSVPAPSMPVAPKAAVPRRVVCPVSGTVFNPRATGGRCPVCGEQVVPAALAARSLPVVSSAGAWLKGGGWRLAALIALLVYQLVIFLLLWHHLADLHAF
jgi:hypothetical protein